MIAKDFFGNEITVGDTVAFMQTGYRSLRSGTVKSITEKTVLISHKETNVCSTETRQFHSQVIVKKQIFKLNLVD
jgi:peroxiredoxin